MSDELNIVKAAQEAIQDYETLFSALQLHHLSVVIMPYGERVVFVVDHETGGAAVGQGSSYLDALRVTLRILVRGPLGNAFDQIIKDGGPVGKKAEELLKEFSRDASPST